MGHTCTWHADCPVRTTLAKKYRHSSNTYLVHMALSNGTVQSVSASVEKPKHRMTVGNLRAQLAQFPDNMPIVNQVLINIYNHGEGYEYQYFTTEEPRTVYIKVSDDPTCIKFGDIGLHDDFPDQYEKCVYYPLNR